VRQVMQGNRFPPSSFSHVLMGLTITYLTRMINEIHSPLGYKYYSKRGSPTPDMQVLSGL
jgi:hypothetical protein